jgi:cell division protein FtsI/penicillin-binding protein 2
MTFALSALLAIALSAQPSAARALAWQEQGEAALGARPGCLVALDPRDGRILSLVRPDLAVRTAFPIGSLAKLVTALAASEAGLADGSRSFRCTGRFRSRRCWKAHGRLNLEGAIAESCSVAFMQLGQEVGGTRLVSTFRRSGFGSTTGSGMAGEADGRLPEPRSDLEVADLACGDTAALRATPMQVAVFVAALANGGTRYRPHPNAAVLSPIGRLPGARGLGWVWQGMRQAVLAGTAQGANLPRYSLFAKTGTAVHSGDPTRRNGWFAGFTPHLALVVYVPDGTGARAAVPVARRFLEAVPR